jgi:hypothetical protein
VKWSVSCCSFTAVRHQPLFNKTWLWKLCGFPPASSFTKQNISFYISQCSCLHGNIILTSAPTDAHLLWAALRWLVSSIPTCSDSARFDVGVLAKAQVFWDMASRPKRLQDIITVLWQLTCDVVAHFLSIVKAEISEAYVSADRGCSSLNPHSDKTFLQTWFYQLYVNHNPCINLLKPSGNFTYDQV